MSRCLTCAHILLNMLRNLMWSPKAIYSLSTWVSRPTTFNCNRLPIAWDKFTVTGTFNVWFCNVKNKMVLILLPLYMQGKHFFVIFSKKLRKQYSIADYRNRSNGLQLTHFKIICKTINDSIIIVLYCYWKTPLCHNENRIPK